MIAPNPYTPWCGEHAAVGGDTDCPRCATERAMFHGHVRAMQMLGETLAADPNVSPTFTNAVVGSARNTLPEVSVQSVPSVMPTFDEFLAVEEERVRVGVRHRRRRRVDAVVVLDVVRFGLLFVALGAVVWALQP